MSRPNQSGVHSPCVLAFGHAADKAKGLAERFHWPCLSTGWPFDAFASQRQRQDLLKTFTSTSNAHHTDFLLFNNDRLGWYSLQSPQWKPIECDFTKGRFINRLKQATPKSELLLRALGRACEHWHLVDATAGLGMDGCLLASRVQSVTLCERNPVVFALLEDGLQRAQQSDLPILVQLMAKMRLFLGDARTLLREMNENPPDAVYCDPMFDYQGSSRDKSLPRKEMAGLRDVVGSDADAESLIKSARQVAKLRVVVKTSVQAQDRSQRTNTIQYKGNSSQFSVYLNT